MAAALALPGEALRLVPGRIAALDRGQVVAAFALADISEDKTGPLMALVDAYLASRGPDVEEIARVVARTWDGNLGALMEAAEEAFRRHTEP